MHGDLKLTGDWKVVFPGLTHHKEQLKKIGRKIVKSEAKFFREQVRKAFITQGVSNGQRWKPSAPTTLDTKKARKTLKNTGRLRRSIKMIGAGDEFFVGVPYGAKTLDGQRMADVASRMEYGEVRTVTVTEAMFSAVMTKLAMYSKTSRPGNGQFLPGNSYTFVVPERSFLRATYKAHMTSEKMEKRVGEHLVDYKL